MRVSPACDACYAEALMGEGGRFARVQWGGPGKGVGTRVRTGKSTWNAPRKWNREAARAGRRAFVFCASLADIFDADVDPSWRADAFQVMRETPELIYLLLTKRPGNILKLVEAAGGLPPNAALGFTAESQAVLQRDLPKILEAAEKLRPQFVFVSIEPMLGPMSLTKVWLNGAWFNALTGNWIHTEEPPFDAKIDWVITGGETDQGPHRARPSNPQWFRDIRDQCEAFEVPYHHKQNGEWASVSEVEGPGDFHTFPDHRTVRRVGKDRSGRSIDGVTHDQRPAVWRLA